MEIKLPEEFRRRMENLLGEEFCELEKSYDKSRVQALRVNTLKISVEEFKAISSLELKIVPWVKEGFYYKNEQRPGKHPFHEAGLYYIQEPSAMSVAALADAKPGEKVLDLCAAPGGKTTQLASSMQGEGLLVSNEIHPARAKILASNVERMGIKNAIVTNETPQKLAKHFAGFFDKIIVDAPCSGEGMFRKEEQALEHWSKENVRLCADRQEEILEAAEKMLAEGGTLVYSTCTFAPEENEGNIEKFLQKYPDFTVKKVEACEKFSHGRPEWGSGREELRDTFRLWPHLLDGEGHFAAVLEREGVREEENCKETTKEKASKESVKLYRQFEEENLNTHLEGEFIDFGDQLYLLPLAVSLKGLKVLRAGLHLGTCKKNRFEPSHALALALKESEAKRVCRLKLAEDGIYAYLRGETVSTDGEKGWTLVLIEGYSIGWGKVDRGVLKNHYPKGLRCIFSKEEIEEIKKEEVEKEER